MNLRILFFLLLYYTIISLVFVTSGLVGVDYVDLEGSGYSIGVPLNSSELTASEIDTGGLFSTGVSFARLGGLVAFGVGLPDDVPLWFQILFSAWQILVLIFTIFFIISSIWDG